jgi:HD-GYP domain-containing protein (c-di-GMP phosphodiesterase class II)
VHFFGIAFSAGFAWLAAVMLAMAGVKRQDGRAVLVGTAFSVMAAILTVHGLSTPGFLVGDNGVVAVSGAATLPAGGAVLALVALPAIRTPRGVKPLLWLQGALMVVILGVGLVGILVPSVVPSVPNASSPPAIVLLVVGLCFYALLALRATRTFLLTRRRSDFVVVVGIVLLSAALIPAMTMEYYELGWWLGHSWELIGIALVGTPVALDLHRGAPSRPHAGDLRAVELVEAADAFMGPTVRALLLRLAEKDAYTEGHTRRVAMLAVQVGEEMSLAPSRLRSLAMGGLVHDIGKLSVDDHILQKPGPLDDDEFAVIKRHPEWGNDLIQELGVFPPAVARLVLDHHERLDGTGYPRGLKANDISLEVRVLAVCDVFDALRSNRVYREAWSQERALNLLREESGTAFDREVVQALHSVVSRRPAEAAISAVA